MATYTINFFNNFSQPGSFCMFQQNPGSPNPNVFSLAWFAQYANPNSMLSFSWTEDYFFVWGQTGQLFPGITFSASQLLPAGLAQNNAVTLTYSNGAYQFVNQQNGYQQGALTVTTTNTIAINQASVGIGMSGSATFVAQAQPNMNFLFAASPEYWVTFGEFQQGRVLDASAISNKVPVIFPSGIYSINVTLNADYTWTMTPSGG